MRHNWPPRMLHSWLSRDALAAAVRAPLTRVLTAVFLFNLGSAAWSAVASERLVQMGQGSTDLGLLYAACDLLRLPATLVLPLILLRWGARRATLVGVGTLLLLPILSLGGLNAPRLMASMLVSALPALVVFVGLPAFVVGASRSGRDGWALAWLGLVGGAGGALGPWMGGYLADRLGLVAPLLLFAVGAALVIPVAWRGPLPDRRPWPGWAVLAGRGLPWVALIALGLASAADAGRAALVPAELVRDGLSPASVGFLLAAGAALAGPGFLLFGRLADRQAPNRVLGAGLALLVLGAFATALAVNWASIYALAAAFLSMGASGVRLGAEVALVGWIGRDRAAVGAALGEVTVASGRIVGAPTLGALGDAHGDTYAFNAIGGAGLVLAMGMLMLAFVGSRSRRPDQPVPCEAAA